MEELQEENRRLREELAQSLAENQRLKIPKASEKSSSVGGGGGGVVGGEGFGEDQPLFKSSLSIEEKVAVVMSVGEEVVMPEELTALFKAKEHPIVYDGFEPSGRMHIAQGVLRAINVNKLTSAGCVFKFWVADWFAQLNNKMGGDLKKIKTVGLYMIEIWKAIGMNMQNVRFLWASDEINSHADTYWTLVMDIARTNNIKRITRCCTIMGRKEDEDMSAAQIFYPCMQCADVFHLQADICQLGMDQRKVNMLAREYAGENKKKYRFKPIIISHHMLMGLKEGQEKMSKSDVESALFMEDTASDITRKVKKAYCPPQVVENNPVMDYAHFIVLGYYGTIDVFRAPPPPATPPPPPAVAESGPAAGATEATTTAAVSASSDGAAPAASVQDPPSAPAGGGGVQAPEELFTYRVYADLEADYLSGLIHPKSLKAAVTDGINRILEPVRLHFSQGEPKKLLEKVKSFQVTR